MECGASENGRDNIGAPAPEQRVRGLKRKLAAGGGRGVRVLVAAAVPRAPARRPPHGPPLAARPPPHSGAARSTPDAPFMSNMDEISYWINTKRAPCLMNYDNSLKKQNEYQCSTSKAVHSTSCDVPSPKKKKRKLSLLIDDTQLVDKQHIYFEAPKQNQRAVVFRSKSGSSNSDIDFNIKTSSIKAKPKRTKMLKSNLTTVHKKCGVVTSTPKVPVAVRRSLRKVHDTLNSTSFDVPFEVFNVSAVSGNTLNGNSKHLQTKTAEMSTKSVKKIVDQSSNGKRNDVLATENLTNKLIQNGQFEDLSDVSGFTANYIRSTKVNSKTSRNLRNKGGRNLMKGKQANSQIQTPQKETLVVSVNKSMNTTDCPTSAVLNCSTDSSQNIINLVTRNGNDRHVNVNKSTSLLKFVDLKPSKAKQSKASNRVPNKQASKPTFNTSSRSRSSVISRYPKRQKKYSTEDISTMNIRSNQSNKISSDTKYKINNISNTFENSDRKENPDETSTSRTRSGRAIRLMLGPPKTSVLVISNSTEQESSEVTMNVANPTNQVQQRVQFQKCLPLDRCDRGANKSKGKNGVAVLSASMRDKSGFAACFSDSDDDNEAVKRQRKFFC